MKGVIIIEARIRIGVIIRIGEIIQIEEIIRIGAITLIGAIMRIVVTMQIEAIMQIGGIMLRNVHQPEVRRVRQREDLVIVEAVEIVDPQVVAMHTLDPQVVAAVDTVDPQAAVEDLVIVAAVAPEVEVAVVPDYEDAN